MLYLWLTALILLNAVWLVLVAFALPGNWLIVITTALFAWWRADDDIFSIYTLLAIAALAVAGELVEFLGAMGGAKKAGVGSCSGAAIGACVPELSAGRRLRDFFRLGIGAGLGRFLGTTTKIAVGLLIWLIVVIAAFWP